MCEHGTTVEVPNLLAYNGAWHRRTWKVDACLASIVAALNRSGTPTVGSCCGHGKGLSVILVASGDQAEYESSSTRIRSEQKQELLSGVSPHEAGAPPIRVGSGAMGQGIMTTMKKASSLDVANNRIRSRDTPKQAWRDEKEMAMWLVVFVLGLIALGWVFN